MFLPKSWLKINHIGTVYGKAKSFRKSLCCIHFHVKIISRHVSVKGCITLSKSWWSTFSKIVVCSLISNSDIGHFLSFHPAFVKTQKYILSLCFLVQYRNYIWDILPNWQRFRKRYNFRKSIIHLLWRIFCKKRYSVVKFVLEYIHSSKVSMLSLLLEKVFQYLVKVVCNLFGASMCIFAWSHAFRIHAQTVTERLEIFLLTYRNLNSV